MNDVGQIIKTTDVERISDIDKQQSNISDEEAANTALQINAPALVDVNDVKKRAELGNWVAGINVSNIAGTGLINQKILERCIEKCFEIINTDNDNTIKLKAVNSINHLVSTSAEWAAIQIKMTEILAASKKKEKNKVKSPNLTIDAVNIQNNYYPEPKSNNE